jgi:hypothetical protein
MKQVSIQRVSTRFRTLLVSDSTNTFGQRGDDLLCRLCPLERGSDVKESNEVFTESQLCWLSDTFTADVGLERRKRFIES